MPFDQSNRATGLLIPWDPDAVGPAHHRLAALLRSAMAQGRLVPGDRLPPTRALAEELGLSRWVVTEAYDQLKAEGYLTGRVGAGTVVADTVTASGSPTASRLSAQAAATELAPLDLSPALPEISSFPRTLWRAAMSHALAHVPDEELAHPHPQGAWALRATMADYLRRVRGIDAGPDRLHVTQGVRSAVLLLCALLKARGAQRVAVEDPSWPRLREAARASGLDVVGVPVDGRGMRVDLLPGLEVDAAFTTATHQFPTGVPLDAGRRGALIGWAAERGALLVEDDYDAEFRYDRRPVGALAALSADHVVYLGSASKSLSPALQVGWMVAPAGLAPGLDAARARVGALVPTLDQHALVHLLASGAYDRHLRRMRRRYQRRRQVFLGALRAHVPGQAHGGMDAGLHILWDLPVGTDEDGVRAACAAAGLRVVTLGQCRLSPAPPGLVLGYANVPEHRAEAVALAIARAVRACLGPGAPW